MASSIKIELGSQAPTPEYRIFLKWLDFIDVEAKSLGEKLLSNFLRKQDVAALLLFFSYIGIDSNATPKRRDLERMVQHPIITDMLKAFDLAKNEIALAIDNTLQSVILIHSDLFDGAPYRIMVLDAFVSIGQERICFLYNPELTGCDKSAFYVSRDSSKPIIPPNSTSIEFFAPNELGETVATHTSFGNGTLTNQSDPPLRFTGTDAAGAHTVRQKSAYFGMRVLLDESVKKRVVSVPIDKKMFTQTTNYQMERDFYDPSENRTSPSLRLDENALPQSLRIDLSDDEILDHELQDSNFPQLIHALCTFMRIDSLEDLDTAYVRLANDFHFQFLNYLPMHRESVFGLARDFVRSASNYLPLRERAGFRYRMKYLFVEHPVMKWTTLLYTSILAIRTIFSVEEMKTFHTLFSLLDPKFSRMYIPFLPPRNAIYAHTSSFPDFFWHITRNRELRKIFDKTLTSSNKIKTRELGGVTTTTEIKSINMLINEVTHQCDLWYEEVQNSTLFPWEMRGNLRATKTAMEALYNYVLSHAQHDTRWISVLIEYNRFFINFSVYFSTFEG